MAEALDPLNNELAEQYTRHLTPPTVPEKPMAARRASTLAWS